MMQQHILPGSKRRFALSLSVQVSLLLVLAALLPLIVTIASSELLSRPQLIARANASMETDAQTHILTIENTFSQPIIDVRSLCDNPALTRYLQGDASAAAAVKNVLAGGYQRNLNYVSWSLIDEQGQQRLSYPVPALAHGRYFIPLETLTQSGATNNATISSGYYNPQGNVLTVDITEPVTASGATEPRVFGYLRATLSMNFIWNMLQGERDANGAGSYAFIVDENGVIIAHTDITRVLTAIAPFTRAQRATIAMLERYGKGTTIPVFPQRALAEKIGQQMPFQLNMQMQRENYQAIGLPVFAVPWTYVVVSPTSVVTSLANQQLLEMGGIGVMVLVLAALLGIMLGQRITLPVLRSVAQLRANSKRLKDLASQEAMTIAQQTWVVDSSRVGLASVNHALNASQDATNYVMMLGKVLEHYWSSIQPEERQRAFYQICLAMDYINGSLQQQKKNGRRLSATLDLTQQVTDQLKSSTAATTRAAEQMEQVVSQLQHVVGRPARL